MFPHERSLVKKLADKPFALIGVNSDKDLEDLKQKNAAAEITWRSFWNGPDGTSGPISKKWNVGGWPTLYLIDHEGVIRNKWLGSPSEEVLDAAIDALIQKAVGTEGAEDSGGEEVVEEAQEQDAEKPSAIIEEFKTAMNAFSKSFRAAKTDEERQKLFESSYPNPAKYMDRVRAAVSAHKGDEAAQGLAWAFANSRDKEDQNWALESLLADHIGAASMSEVAASMVYSQADGVDAAIERLLAENEHASVKGATLYTKALRAKRSLRNAEDKEAKTAEVLAMLERVRDEFGAVEHPYRGTLAAAAGGDLFEMTRLQVGEIAPDIEGVDIDGVAFKLSDYRGKVVFLDFWGHW